MNLSTHRPGSLGSLKVHPEPHPLTSPLKAGLRSVERVKPSKPFGVGSVLLFAGIVLLASASISGAKEQDALLRMYESARVEGEVVWQFSGAVKDIKSVIDAFRKKYPHINVSAVSLGAATIGTRVIVEANAKKLSVDVGTSSPTYMLPVIERDLLVRYNWTQMIEVDPKRILFDGRMIAYTDSPRVWVYNTRLVSKAEAPKTWEDTLHPKWKGGKIAVRAAPSGFNLLYPVWKQNRQKAMDYLKRLAQQEVVPGTRDSEVANRVATGESAIGVLSIVSSVVPALKEGAPLALCPIGPTASDPFGFWIPKGAPHPNAAKFLMAWLTSPEGTMEFLKGGRGGPSYPPDASSHARLLADNGIGFVPIESPKDIQEYTGPFAEAVVKIMGFKPE